MAQQEPEDQAPIRCEKKETVMSICKFCGTEIDWIQTANGLYTPIDVDPVFVIEGEGTEQFIEDTGTAIIGRIARPEEEKRDLSVAFVPHMRTCGNKFAFR